MKSYVMRNQQIMKYNGQCLLEVEDDIASEFPLTIYVNGEEFATMVCTPSHVEELIYGFLASEGFIRSYLEVTDLSVNEERGLAYVELEKKGTVNKDFYSKRFIGSCCGKSRQFYFHNDARTAKTITKKRQITVAQCIHLMKMMQANSSEFHLTGGLHNASLCTRDEVIVTRADIGRHNALDKVYGYCLQNQIPVSDKVIAFSGRISSEVLLKASKIGVGVILSKSAPTTLALDLANDLGITTVGFIRDNGLNVYTHEDRILVEEEIMS